MSYPQQIFPDFNSLMTYMNTFWVTNGNEEITGVVGNNVVNGLLTFIRQSPLNWQSAKVWSVGSSVSVTQPVNVFMITAPSSVAFLNNIYNEYTFVNTTNSNIPFATGNSYYDVMLNNITYIPSHQVLNISKAQNGLWLQTNNFANTSASGEAWQQLNFIVGDSVMINGQILLTISSPSTKINSVKITVDGIRLYPSVLDQFSYNLVYNAGNFEITFLNDGGSGNQGVQGGQKIIIDYAQISF